MAQEIKSAMYFAATERALLTEDLAEDLYETINTHAEASTLTIPEVIGVLEMVKHQLLTEQVFGISIQEDSDEDDD